MPRVRFVIEDHKVKAEFLWKRGKANLPCHYCGSDEGCQEIVDLACVWWGDYTLSSDHDLGGIFTKAEAFLGARLTDGRSVCEKRSCKRSFFTENQIRIERLV